MTAAGPARQRLLLFLCPADHPHRDAACATLAWVARDEGSLFECYFSGQASGVHYGGGHPAHVPAADLRGGTFTGSHHLEQLYQLLLGFECEVARLGPSVLDGVLGAAGIPVRAAAPNIASFYMQVFSGSPVKWPAGLLVVGDGGRPQDVPLGAYAFPEVVNRRLLAISAGDEPALEELRPGLEVESLWQPPGTPGRPLETPAEASVSVQTRWMAERWSGDGRGLMIGDPELVGRWTPTAVREGWLPVFGLPQSKLIKEMGEALAPQHVVFGRQQDDRDFIELSRAGVAFQLIDPGRPAFPVTKASGWSFQTPDTAPGAEPDDAELERWAKDNRVLSTLLFWAGMVRELESLYALADLFSLSGVAAGVVLTTASFEYMSGPPLSLAYVPRELGGLAPGIEILLASGGAGAFIESEVPGDRFAAMLSASVARLTELIGGRDRLPRGWWGTMDARLLPRTRQPRLTRQPEPPYVRIRYRGGSAAGPAGPAGATTARPSRPSGSRRLRRLVRSSPVGRLFEPLRPFDGYQPGPPGRAVLEAVRDAGFEYAFTKSAFGGSPAAVSGVTGLTTLNYTVGRWDGWTPFVTINSIADLEQAERRLVGAARPAWLAGTLDTCLWAFTGPIWERAPKLRAICDWLVQGGASGRLVNVTPRTVSRYARLLADSGRVRQIPAG